MKRNILGQIIACSLLTITTINPVIASGFSGQMTFSGTIANTGPKWVWELNQTAQTENNALNVDQVNGIKSGPNIEWSFNPKTKVWLKGYTDKAFPNPALGTVPEVSFGKTVLNGVSQDINLSTKDGVGTVTVTAYEERASIITIGNLERYMVAFNFKQKSESAEYISWLKDLGRTVHGYQSISEYGNGNSFDWMTRSGWTATKGYITRSRVSGTIVTQIKLSYPKASIPSTWSAILPITVAIK